MRIAFSNINRLTVLAVLVSVVSDEESIVIGIAPLYAQFFSRWLLSGVFS